MKKTQVTPQKPRKQARSQKARSPKGQGERWSFSLGETEWGPFKTKGAKIDSRSLKTARSAGMVGLGSRAIDIQRKMPRLSSTLNENGNVVDILDGTDFLAAVNSAAVDTSQAGDILYKQEISPSKFLETRLKQFADLYQRYRFRKIHFLYEPIANATQSGQVLGFADFDVDNQLTLNSPENLSIAAAHQGEAITQIWEPMLFDMGQVFSFTDLYTEAGASNESDPRLSVQGVFYLIAASVINGGLPLGNIYIDYEIEFSIPFLSAQVSSSRQSHGFFQCTASAASVDVAYQTGSVTQRSARGPVQFVASNDTSQTLGWGNCRPGDVVWVEVLLNGTFTGTVSASSQTFAVSALNGSVDQVNARQIWGDNGYTLAASFVLTASSSIGTSYLTANFNNLFPGEVAMTMMVSWVLDPAPVTLRGLRRQAMERDHSRIMQLEDKIATLLSRLEVASSSLPPTKEKSVVPAKGPGGGFEFIPRSTPTPPTSSGGYGSSLRTSEQVLAGGASSTHAHQSEGPSRGPLDRYH